MELAKDEIYTFKLNSGEELIAKVVEVTESYLVVTEPVSIGPSPNGGLGLVPSMFTYNNRKNVRLNTNSLALVAETDESVKTKYIEATTGLQVPDKKVLLG
jgi:hypothetical protein